MELKKVMSKDIFPNDWNSFKKISRIEKGPTKLANVDPDTLVGLEEEAKDVFTIWSIFQRIKDTDPSKKVLSALSDTIHSPKKDIDGLEDENIEASGLINKLRLVLGSDKEPVIERLSEKSGHKMPGVLGTFNPAKLVTGNAEDREDDLEKTPEQLFVKRMNEGWASFKEDAEQRFPSKTDDEEFVSRVAKAVVARTFCDELEKIRY